MESFRNFDLRLSGTLSAVSVQVQDSPDGELSAPITLPCTVSTELLGDLQKLSLGNDLLHSIGCALWRCTFGAPAVAERWRVSVAKVEPEGTLRLRLVIETPELAALPWELLYDETKKHYLALDTHTPVVRYVPLPYSPFPWPQNRALRFLFTGASPSDKISVAVANEWAVIKQETAGLVKAKRLEMQEILDGATRERLAQALERKVDIWHFAGHGDKNGLVFTDMVGKADPTDAETLHQILTGERVRLAVINACRAGEGGGQAASVAGTLMRAGIPAVVAMQADVPDATARAFASAFYKAIAYGQGVDQAITKARKKILAIGTTEWWTPALFMRTPESQIWHGLQQVGVADQPYSVSSTVTSSDVSVIVLELHEWKFVHNEIQEILTVFDVPLALLRRCRFNPQNSGDLLDDASENWQTLCVRRLRKVRDNWTFEYAISPVLDDLRKDLERVESVTTKLRSLDPTPDNLKDLYNDLVELRSSLWSMLVGADKRIMVLVNELKKNHLP